MQAIQIQSPQIAAIITKHGHGNAISEQSPSTGTINDSTLFFIMKIYLSPDSLSKLYCTSQ